MFPAEQKATVFSTAWTLLAHYTDFFDLLVGNERFWQLLKLTQTPTADSQYLLLMQYNLFILLQPLFQFRYQDCVWASSHDNYKNLVTLTHVHLQPEFVLVILPSVRKAEDFIITKWRKLFLPHNASCLDTTKTCESFKVMTSDQLETRTVGFSAAQQTHRKKLTWRWERSYAPWYNPVFRLQALG